MQSLRNTVYVLILPTVVCLMAACEKAGTPTEPQSAAGLTPAFKDDHNSNTTRWVNDDDPNGGDYSAPGTSCDDPGYPTVQSAVTAADPGDRINV